MSRAEIQAFPYHPKSMRRPPSASELPTLLLPLAAPSPRCSFPSLLLPLAAPSPHCSFPLLPSSYVSSCLIVVLLKRGGRGEY